MARQPPPTAWVEAASSREESSWPAAGPARAWVCSRRQGRGLVEGAGGLGRRWSVARMAPDLVAVPHCPSGAASDKQLHHGAGLVCEQEDLPAAGPPACCSSEARCQTIHQ